MKLTPREPTPEMISKARRVDGIDALVASTVWRAMHDAAPSGWQPIETAPKDGTEFWAAQVGAPGCGVICWNDDLEHWQDVLDGYEVLSWTTTHWMPLPAPPSEKGE